MADTKSGFNQDGIRVYYVEGAGAALVKIKLSEKDRQFIPKPEGPLPGQVDKDDLADEIDFLDIVGDSIGPGNELSSGDPRDLEYQIQMEKKLVHIIEKIGAFTLSEDKNGNPIIKGIPKGQEKAFAEQLGKALLKERQGVITTMVDEAREKISPSAPAPIVDDIPKKIPAGGAPEVTLHRPTEDEIKKLKEEGEEIKEEADVPKEIRITIPHITQGNFEQIEIFDPKFYNEVVGEKGEKRGELLEKEYRDKLEAMIEEYSDEIDWSDAIAGEMSTELIHNKSVSHWPLRHQELKGKELTKAIRQRLNDEYKNFPKERYTQEHLKKEIRDLETQQGKVQSQLAGIEKEIKDIQADITADEEAKRKLDEQLGERDANVELLGGVIKKTNDRIEQTKKQLERTKETLTPHQAELALITRKIITRHRNIAKIEIGNKEQPGPLARDKTRFERRANNAKMPFEAISKSYTNALRKQAAIESIKPSKFGVKPHSVEAGQDEAKERYHEAIRDFEKTFDQILDEGSSSKSDAHIALNAMRSRVEKEKDAYENVQRKFENAADAHEDKQLDMGMLAVKEAEAALEHAEVTGNTEKIDAYTRAVATRQKAYDTALAAVEKNRKKRAAAQAAPAAEEPAPTEPTAETEAAENGTEQDAAKNSNTSAAAAELLKRERAIAPKAIKNAGRPNPNSPTPDPRNPNDRGNQGIGGR